MEFIALKITTLKFRKVNAKCFQNGESIVNKAENSNTAFKRVSFFPSCLPSSNPGAFRFILCTFARKLNCSLISAQFTYFAPSPCFVYLQIRHLQERRGNSFTSLNSESTKGNNYTVSYRFVHRR